VDLRRPQGRKRGHCEEEARGSFWRGTTIAIDSRLRIGRAIAKTEEEVALELMTQLKERCGRQLIAVHTQVVYGDPQEVKALLGEQTAYVERTHLTSRQMNGRLVRKSLSYSKRLRLLRAACSWEDWVYNLTRPVKTLRVEQVAGSGQQRWQPRAPAMTAGLTDHIWTIKELLMTVVLPSVINTK